MCLTHSHATVLLGVWTVQASEFKLSSQLRFVKTTLKEK